MVVLCVSMKYTLQVLGIGQKLSVITFLKHNCYPVENTRKLILLIKANLTLFFTQDILGVCTMGHCWITMAGKFIVL